MLYSFYIDSTHTKTSSVVTFQIAIFDLKFGDDFDWLLNLETSNENITASDCWRGLEFFCPANYLYCACFGHGARAKASPHPAFTKSVVLPCHLGDF